MKVIIDLKLSNDNKDSREDVFKQIKSQLFLLGVKSTDIEVSKIIIDDYDSIENLSNKENESTNQTMADAEQTN